MVLPKVIAVAGVAAALAVVVPKVAPDLFATLLSAPAAVPAERTPARRSGLRQVALAADRRGHFIAEATVNGRTVEMFVDTGATAVALDEATARRLGLTPARGDYTRPIATANGVIRAAPVTLADIRIGDVAVKDVDAVVVPGEGLAGNLLGMSFLGRLSRFEVAGDRLLLVE